MAGVGPTDLFDLCNEFLAACVEAVAAAAGGPIGRSYVSPGRPALDCCPQLTVHAGGPAEGDTLPLQPPLQPGRRPGVTGAVHLVAMTCTVVRCVPVVTSGGGQAVSLPSSASMQAVAQETLGDLWAIWNHVRHRYRARTLFVRADGEQRELFFDPAVSLLTSGGCAGWEVQVRVALEGFPAGVI